jgi:hypothetical protein
VNYVDQAIQLIDRQIAELQEVRRRLVGIGANTGVTPLRRRTVSPEVRKRMADSQRKRWEAAKAKKKQPNHKQNEK